jgi:protease PrsW
MNVGNYSQPASPSISPRALSFIGGGLWALGCLIGAAILCKDFVIEPLLSGRTDILVNEFIAALIAVPACAVYVWVPLIIDRYEPEPWWMLLMTFLWGALAAAGFSVLVNTAWAEQGQSIGGELGGDILGGMISAPFTEEACKGVAVLGLLWFMRREFDGVVDGVIYATFSALGFAVSENVLYYSQSLAHGGLSGHAFSTQFLVRGLLAPWGHPLYTSLTGIGVGIARETPKPWLKIAAPIGFYFMAVTLHGTWNTMATLLPGLIGTDPLYVMVPLYGLLLVFFLGIVTWLVVREGRALRRSLQDEVYIGNLAAEHLELVCSPVGRIRSALGAGGPQARHIIRVAIRLGMAKWHLSRAMKAHKGTFSMDAIAPLRQELLRLRHGRQG